MLQRTQLRHHRHQTRILTLHPHFLPHLDILPLEREYLMALVMFRELGRETETLAKRKTGEGFRGKGERGCTARRGDDLKSADM